MILIDKVNISYKPNTVILENASIKIEKGSWISIVGPSGSGKTSLLKLIGGLLLPESGTVLIDNYNLYQMTANERHTFIRDKVGFVYQQFRLLPQFSVLENVMLPLIPYEKKKKIRDNAEAIIDKIGLSNRLNHLPSELSGGEQQRVAFARALLTNPPILICDEPTGNLDAANRDNILQLLEHIHEEGHTIILATHDEIVANRGQQILEIEKKSFVERERIHG
ncbi:ABC transporter ATP-binding protein [Ornithinibacillus bavariensis]|uniref:ABC transporter ATP-binding protein n=1 Tax=Ornithinibacillus bavariensis TaxID=545502 RepID=A0A920C648_9BACI|nr:ABC transporter ATP-binding protein [Ornithinibacillus bavariensis]GIO27536.1 ABC transporter ATP-binding protein [Ornithinibacillus bavariensis]